MAGASFRSPLLICLLNLTLNKKLSLHSLQFASKYYVSLDSLRGQIRDHTYRNSVTVAIYYTGVELEKCNKPKENTHTENRESNYRGHSNPVDHQVKRANNNAPGKFGW